MLYKLQILGDILVVFIIIIVVKAIYSLHLLLLPLHWRLNQLAFILYYFKESVILLFCYFRNRKRGLLLNHLTNTEGLICIHQHFFRPSVRTKTIIYSNFRRGDAGGSNRFHCHQYISVRRHFWPFGLQDNSKQILINVCLLIKIFVNKFCSRGTLFEKTIKIILLWFLFGYIILKLFWSPK